MRRSMAVTTVAWLLAGCVAAQSGGEPARSPLPRLLAPIPTALVWARVAGAPVPYDEVAYGYPELGGGLDEFQRRDRLAAARAKLEKLDRELARERLFIVLVDDTLKDYDFTRGGFPNTLTNKSYIPMPSAITGMKGAPFAIALTNGTDFGFVAVGDSVARKALERDITRQAQLELVVEPVAAGTRPLIPLEPPTRVLDVRIRHLRLVARGAVLGETDVPRPAARP